METFPHEIFMHRAIQLAKLGGSSVFPNPLVGAVIVHRGKIIGEGYHQGYGLPHAEVNAVNSVQDKSLLSNSTIYVCLEPCSHHGKTPPCVDLLLKEKFSCVVIGCQDPFAKVNGSGIRKLYENGIEVITPILEEGCRELNRRFFTFHQQKRPYIILKWAESNDGFLDKIRTNEKGINRITGELAAIRTHTLRSQEHAILVGWKTIDVDNPQLTTRKISGNNPLRIILDRQLQSNPNAIVYSDGLPTLVLNEKKNETNGSVRFVQTSMDKVQDILKALFELNIVSIMVEGGATTLNEFLAGNCWDEIHRFTGDVYFHEGIKTIPVAAIPVYQEKLDTDLLTIYRK